MKIERASIARLTNANDVEISLIIANCGLLGATTSEATRACLNDGTKTLLLLKAPSKERSALSNHIVLYLQLIYK